MKLLRIALCLCLLSGAAWSQTASDLVQGKGAKGSNTQTISVSGNAATINNNLGGVTTTFEEIIAGAPATVSIVIRGCMQGGTCDTLDTYTTVANSIRKPTISSVYDYYTVTASWTGGSSPTVKVNTTVTTARSGGGSSGPCSDCVLTDPTGDQTIAGAHALILSNPGAQLTVGTTFQQPFGPTSPQLLYVGPDWGSLNADLQFEAFGQSMIVNKSADATNLSSLAVVSQESSLETPGLDVADGFTDDGTNHAHSSSLFQTFHYGPNASSSVNQIMSAIVGEALQSAEAGTGALHRMASFTALNSLYSPSGSGTVDDVTDATGFMAFTVNFPDGGPGAVVTNHRGFYATKAAIFDGATGDPNGTVTNEYGFYADDLHAAGTNTYAVYLADQGTGSSNYALYSAGGKSYLKGGLLLESAAPTAGASQIAFGGTTAASSNCGSLSGFTGCMVINVGGTTRYIPYK